MKITEVNIPKSKNDNGLDDIKMTRLGKIVIVAGKNGAGKTRLFTKVFASDNSSNEIVYEPKNGTIRIVPFILDPAIDDYRNFTPLALKNQANATGQAGTSHLASSTAAYIQVIQNRWYSAHNPMSSIPQDKKIEADTAYENLKSIIMTVLGETIDRDGEDEVTMSGVPLGVSTQRLSEGQRILLKLCVAIHSQKASINDVILFMDEPENHLHPSAILDALDRISELVTDGQIWIATHSLPIIAHFDPNSLWYMENGIITHGKNKPEKLLSGLLGDDKEKQKLHDLIGLPDRLALTRFACECLLPPSVVMTGPNDSQMRQAIDIINEIIERKGKAKILDYGAGKGRIPAYIAESDDKNLAEFTSKYDYVAFDDSNENESECKRNIKKAFGASEYCYYNDSSQLLSSNRNTFDLVVMCNVLHEIHPENWLGLFHADNVSIASLLADDGFLVIIEDNYIPDGEKAHKDGFIILDTPHLKELFSNQNGEFSCKSERNGRLKCHVIPRSSVLNVTSESICKTLESVQSSSKNKIIELRKKGEDYSAGRLHALHVMQYANASLALDSLDGD